MTVLEVLNESTYCLKRHRVENPRLNAELLLAKILNLSREGLYLHFRQELGDEEKGALDTFVGRRASGEPLQYILGHQEFWEVDVRVSPSVLIPRPETEHLLEEALSILREISFERRPSLLELGTGSGAIAISLAKEVKDLFLVATDISREALLLSKENAFQAGVLDRIEFVRGDLLEPFRLSGEREKFDVILSNPPYICRSDIGRLAREVKDFEPIIALDGGEDGLDFHRRITSAASFYLRKGGWLLLEVGQGQGRKVSQLMEDKGEFLRPQRIQDLSGIERVVKAQRKEEME
jgi:release factor glutamine methyltransferase